MSGADIHQGTLFGQGELFADGAPDRAPRPACRPNCTLCCPYCHVHVIDVHGHLAYRACVAPLPADTSTISCHDEGFYDGETDPPPAPVAPPAAPRRREYITCCLCGYSSGKRHLFRPYAGSETAQACDNRGACEQRQDQPEAFRHVPHIRVKLDARRGGAR